jgi:carbamoyltransferase
MQYELERAMIYKAEALYQLTGVKNLCLGGGVALNCVANRKILDNTSFERIYICPAPGDSGQCLGNALYGWTAIAGQPRRQMEPLGPYLGRSYSVDEVLSSIDSIGDRLTAVKTSDVAEDTAHLLADGHVIGWFQGGSELGPRALGGRSILADPRQPAMKDYLNLIVKRRDPFRPYGPSVLDGSVEEFYDLTHRSPYMELTASADHAVRKVVPAVTHVDGSSRPQTVATYENALFVRLIETFRNLTGLPLILNTSFNLGGEPIVESPTDALECFLRSDLDVVVIENFIVRRSSESLPPRFFTWASSG